MKLRYLSESHFFPFVWDNRRRNKLSKSLTEGIVLFVKQEEKRRHGLLATYHWETRQGMDHCDYCLNARANYMHDLRQRKKEARQCEVEELESLLAD